MTNAPKVLLIDDDEASIALLPSGSDSRILHPNDGGFGTHLEQELQTADLVLLDHNLALSGELSLMASDGASFVGHLRSWARKRRVTLPPLVIFTSEYDAFSQEVPSVGPAVPLGGSFEGHEARLAPTLDVEWLIAKDPVNSGQQISALARACIALRKIAENDRASLSEIQRFLAPPAEAPWETIAAEHITRARAPVGEPESTHHDGTRGVTPVLRWLLHRALPYPGLFISDLHAAWTLGIEPASLPKIVERAANSNWTRELAGCIYTGPASELFSRRWWAAGVDFAAWQLRQESESMQSSPRAALTKLAGPDLDPAEGSEKVVVVDTDFNEQGFAPIEEAMQLHPPGWPAAAAEPWMRRDMILAEPLMQSMLDPTDRALLE